MGIEQPPIGAPQLCNKWSVELLILRSKVFTWPRCGFPVSRTVVLSRQRVGEGRGIGSGVSCDVGWLVDLCRGVGG